MGIRKTEKTSTRSISLGKMLLFGKETDRDAETGIALLTASAEQGMRMPQDFGKSYYSGRLKIRLPAWRPSVCSPSLRGILKDRLAKKRGRSAGGH